jgi:putative flippase GtrA
MTSRLTSVEPIRWLKFALIGAIGTTVQLGVLAWLTAMKVNYLAATGLAVEVAVVHNFLWHQRLTWADRVMYARETGQPKAIQRLFRFQLSNGGISLAGNLVFMRVLVGLAGIPVRFASLLSIAICFCGNFLASDRWVFSSERDSVGSPAELG